MKARTGRITNMILPKIFRLPRTIPRGRPGVPLPLPVTVMSDSDPVAELPQELVLAISPIQDASRTSR
jgi:hypothetical protein